MQITSEGLDRRQLQYRRSCSVPQSYRSAKLYYNRRPWSCLWGALTNYKRTNLRLPMLDNYFVDSPTVVWFAYMQVQKLLWRVLPHSVLWQLINVKLEYLAAKQILDAKSGLESTDLRQGLAYLLWMLIVWWLGVMARDLKRVFPVSLGREYAAPFLKIPASPSYLAVMADTMGDANLTDATSGLGVAACQRSLRANWVVRPTVYTFVNLAQSSEKAT